MIYKYYNLERFVFPGKIIKYTNGQVIQIIITYLKLMVTSRLEIFCPESTYFSKKQS